jgi:hypothetical protein
MPRKQSPTTETLDAVWQRRATADAVAAVRKVFEDGDIPRGTLVGRLSDHELGWVATAAIFAWIKSRAEAATSLGWDTEEALRLTGTDPEPWDVGAVARVLPELGQLPGLDWTKPIGAWSKEDIIRFLLTATKLVATAMVARNVGGGVSNPGSLGEGNGARPKGATPFEPPF